MARKAVSTRTRFEIFKRDKFACQYCGKSPPTVILEIDHVTPVSGGGDNAPENLITACEGCNAGKAAVPLASVLKPLAETIQAERQKAAQLAQYNEWLLELRNAREDDFELVSDALMRTRGDYKKGWVIAGSWAATIRALLKRMPAQQILEAIEIADGRFSFRYEKAKTFKYFCGVCWRMVGRAEGTET